MEPYYDIKITRERLLGYVRHALGFLTIKYCLEWKQFCDVFYVFNQYRSLLILCEKNLKQVSFLER
jgi:hypothetical protein